MAGKVKVEITLMDGTKLNGEGILDNLMMTQEKIEVTMFGSLQQQFIPGLATYKVSATLNSLISGDKNVMEDSALRETVGRLTRKLDR